MKEMAFLLPNLSPSLLHQIQSKEKPIPQHQTIAHSAPKPTSFSLSPLSLSSSLTSLQTPPSLEKSVAQDNGPNDAQDKQQQKDDFYVNLGLAVRTLREDLPLIFTKDLNYDIYRYLTLCYWITTLF